VRYNLRMRAAAALALVLLGCGDFKTSSPATSNDGGGGNDGATSGATGPGPYGALPTGYCCTKNEDCRYRQCTSFGGVMMCSDPCDSNDGCNTAPNMQCNTTTTNCEPIGTPSCIPADQWQLGTKTLGACCVATHDGHAGQECVGNRCVSFGDVSNPFICTQACSRPSDCPGNYMCSADQFCIPLATTYTCQ